MSTLTSREFNQDTGRAKKEALTGPVYITDRGRPSHVLLSYEEYRAMTEKKASIGEMLSMDGVEDIEFAPGKLTDKAAAAEF
ncbi:type II toxin-antitoxin system Phd/YefM family antitoxin [Alkalimarinus coralli]|uniref:type II toxin-antitoxin system Phd/YefM family antitoxin n=1 Tax=Alkalimarinus coralli TaxID=2935863 RepID=UPI00202B3ABB|nr:type II toxin-antitoxin system Phd/YefM family antitoxin [Alkalimarinus coralli]